MNDLVILFWNIFNIQLRVPHDYSNNVATMQFPPGYKKFCAFISKIGYDTEYTAPEFSPNTNCISDKVDNFFQPKFHQDK